MKLKTCPVVTFNKAKSYFFAKMNKVNKIVQEKKIEKAHITNISNDEGNIITDYRH